MLDGAAAGAGAQVLDVELEILVLVDVARRALRFGVQVVYGVRVESRLLCTSENMIQTGRMGEAEYAVTVRQMLAPWNLAHFLEDGSEKRKKKTHEGSNFGAQTIARLSGSITWYPACVCKSLELMKHV